MEFRFYAMLCSNFGNENFDAGHVKSLQWPQLARMLHVLHTWFIPSLVLC